MMRQTIAARTTSLLVSLVIAALLVLLARPAAADESPAPDSSWSRWSKDRFRHAVTGRVDGADERFGMSVDDAWSSAPDTATRVVLVHGFNASPDSMRPLAAALRDRGHPCAVATYPNDQAIDRSATRLADDLKALTARAGDASVAVVTHSMGGLVARRVLEDPELVPTGVDRLIMIAPPNHGSSLARLAYGIDVWEQVGSARDRSAATRFFHAVDDGLAEAANDLTPDSPFLTRLNARPRNARIAYTIVLGDRGRITQQSRERLRESLTRWTPGGDAVDRRIHRWLDGWDELTIGRGDGAVAIERGRLDGVDDVHVLPGDHFMVGLKGPAGPRLLALVCERLGS